MIYLSGILKDIVRSYKKYAGIFFIMLLHAAVFAQDKDSVQNNQVDTFQDTSSTASFNLNNTAAKKYKITGIVKDKRNQEIIPFATVFFPGSSIGVPGDEDGTFLLEFDAFPNDTLKVQVMGYSEYSGIVNKSVDSQFIVVELGSSSTQLGEVVIRPHEDPIVALLKKVIAKKPVNNPEKFENYSYESYNKVEIDIFNLSKEEFEKLPIPYLKKFSFIYDNIDTSSGIPILPFYLTETISDYYYQSKPRKTKEYVRASRVKGINNVNFTRTMTKYLGNMFLTINPYDNYVLFFDKRYVSPINNAGLAFYEYTIIDTTVVDGFDVINLHFKPRRFGENCFEGMIGIVDSVFALQYISADVPKEANINWIKNASFYKNYEPLGDSIWFCVKENTTAELQALADFPFMPSLRVTRTNSYADIKVNEDTIAQIVNSQQFKLDVVIADSANEYTTEYWETARHEKLNKNELAIYKTFDSLENSPVYTKFKKTLRFLAGGVVRFGPIELGPYWNSYTFNNIEGHRFQFSAGTTPKFSKNLYLNGYIAYGTRDERYKYRMEALWLLHKEFPRSFLFATYTHDIDATVNNYDYVNYNNLVVIRKSSIPLKFMFTDNARLEYLKEYYSGFSHMFTILHKRYDPYPPLPDVNVFSDQAGNNTSVLKQTEVNVLLRYAYKERFLNGNYYRTSLGSKYPIVELRYGLGIKGFLDGAYDYHRVNFRVSDYMRIAPFGALSMNVFCGKYWGTLPYPLLQAHPGNESYIYNRNSFSMMSQYEFISDQYAGMTLEHSIGGGIFNYIPLVKKLKFRQFWNVKGVIGSLTDSNQVLNFNKGFAFRTLAGNPYIEVGTGIENILRLIRIDFVWRVAPKRLPGESYDKYFGVFGSLKLSF